VLTRTPVDIVREHFVSWISRFDISFTVRMERGLSKIRSEGRISQPSGGGVEVARFLFEGFFLCCQRPLLFLGLGFAIFLCVNHNSSLFTMAGHFIQRRDWVLLRLPLVRSSSVSGSWLHSLDILVVLWRLQLTAVDVNVSLVQPLRVVSFSGHRIWIHILILHLDSFVDLFIVLLFALWGVRSCELSVLVTVHGLPFLWASLHCYLLYLAIGSGLGVSRSANVWTLSGFPEEDVANAFGLLQSCFSKVIKLSFSLTGCKEIFSLSTSSVFLILQLLFSHSMG
jgi:hypothetical protein